MGGIGAGLNNLQRGITDLPNQMQKVGGKGKTGWKNEVRAGSIGMKLLGGCMIVGGLAAGASAITAVALVSVPAGIIGGVACIGLTILGYDVAEVGTNLGDIADPTVKSAGNMAKNVAKKGFSAMRHPIDTAKNLLNANTEDTVKTPPKTILKAHSLVFGGLLSEAIVQIAGERLGIK